MAKIVVVTACPTGIAHTFMAAEAVKKTGALSMFFGCTLHAPHRGIFVLAIPNAVGQLLPYIGAIAAGTVVTTLALTCLLYTSRCV